MFLNALNSARRAGQIKQFHFTLFTVKISTHLKAFEYLKLQLDIVIRRRLLNVRFLASNRII